MNVFPAVDTHTALQMLVASDFTMKDLEDDIEITAAASKAANCAAKAACNAARAAEAAATAANNSIGAILQAGWRPTGVPSPHDGISKAIAEFAVQCGLPVYVTIDTVLHIIATIWYDEHLRAQTAMSFVPLNYQSVAAASFTLVLGSMRYSGLLHQMAVQHEPGDPDVKSLDVQSFPVVWPANLPASLNMKVYSVLGMGIIMLASNPLQ